MQIFHLAAEATHIAQAASLRPATLHGTAIFHSVRPAVARRLARTSRPQKIHTHELGSVECPRIDRHDGRSLSDVALPTSWRVFHREGGASGSVDGQFVGRENLNRKVASSSLQASSFFPHIGIYPSTPRRCGLGASCTIDSSLTEVQEISMNWISPTEQLPEPNVVVRVLFSDGKEGVGELRQCGSAESRLRALHSSGANSEITHWQPMPAAE